MATRDPDIYEPLSAAQRAQRRALRGQQARRRRIAAGAFAAVCALVLLIASTQSSARHPHHAAAAATAIAKLPRHGAVVHARKAASLGGPAAIDKLLRRTSYVALGSRHKREVALTFDDGPGPTTPKIIATLRRYHVPATFFLVGRWVVQRPGLVRKEARLGFAIGDHTQDHAFLGRLGPGLQAHEIDTAEREIRAAGAPAPELFRPPYGSFDNATLALLRARRLLMVLWSVDTKDFSRPGALRIAYTAISGAQPGAVILMHDGGGDRSQTLAALPRIIKRLRHNGYKLVTVPQLVRDAPPHHNPPPRSLAGG